MKKKTILITTIAVLALALCAVFAACGPKAQEKKFDYVVTFNYNVGLLADSKGIEDQYLGVKKDGLVGVKPSADNDSFKEAQITGYFLEGWYLPQTDKNGTPIIDEETQRVKLGEKWDFATGKVTKDMTLYANFSKKATLYFVDRADGKVVGSMTDFPGKTRKEPSTDSTKPSKKGYTFKGYYFTGIDGEEKFSWPYTFGTDDKNVYVEFVEGDFKIVRTPEEFSQAIRGNSGRNNVYLDADLDFAGKTWTANTVDYKGKLIGNGHTIKNVTLNFEASKNNSIGFGLFGTLTSTSSVSDLIIENLEITFKIGLGNGYKVGAFAWKAEKGAKISNVAISGELHYDFESIASSDTAVEEFIGNINDDKDDNKINPEDITECNYEGVSKVDDKK